MVAIDVSKHFSADVRKIISYSTPPGNIIEFLLAMEFGEYEPSRSHDYDLKNIRTGKRVEVKTDLLKSSTFASTFQPDKFDEVILVDLGRIAMTGYIFARLVTKDSLLPFLTARSNGMKRLTLAKYNEMVTSKNWEGGGYRKDPARPSERKQKLIELVRQSQKRSAHLSDTLS